MTQPRQSLGCGLKPIAVEFHFAETVQVGVDTHQPQRVDVVYRVIAANNPMTRRFAGARFSKNIETKPFAGLGATHHQAEHTAHMPITVKAKLATSHSRRVTQSRTMQLCHPSLSPRHAILFQPELSKSGPSGEPSCNEHWDENDQLARGRTLFSRFAEHAAGGDDNRPRTHRSEMRSQLVKAHAFAAACCHIRQGLLPQSV